MSKSDLISVTPLIGGRTNTGVCALLEIGSVKILLDCGCSTINDNNHDFLHVVNYVKQLKGSISAILISHADIHHMGGLPLLLGKNGITDIPIICTLPVYKFGQVILYDHLMNQLMEGSELKSYDFDDIDLAFNKVNTVKFNQSINIPNNQHSIITVSALRSGRTVGGSMWKIRCGPTEILYMMDINLKKEIVLDSVSFDILPVSPALMIVEGNCVHQATSSSSAFVSSDSTVSGDRTSTRRGRKDKDESSVFLSFILEKLRSNSNVLIPCETVGRTLELMQLLGKFWYDQKLGMYNLIFLSHMAKNVPEFARMQLEWMSDSLSKAFYNGKPNPFELPQIQYITSIKDMDRRCPGPKLVLATDNGLTYGLSKELLLKWGGDPRCCVVFIDSSDIGTLAADLRMKYPNPPVIATITKPVRVELTGNELVQYRIEQEKQRRLKEESIQRKRRQEELSKFHVDEEVELIDDEDDADLLNIESNISTDKDHLNSNNSGNIKKKVKTDIVNKFLEPSFLMFESHDVNLAMDEYGASIDDLAFKDIQSIDVKWLTKDKSAVEGDKTATGETNTSQLRSSSNRTTTTTTTTHDNTINDNDDEEDGLDSYIIPTKLVSTTMKVQFTCEFKEFNLSGRADFKAIKAVTSKITPSRICVLRGNEDDSNTFLTYTRSIDVNAAYAPKNYQNISFEVKTEKLKLQVSQSLLPSSMKIMKTFSTTTNTLIDSKCSIAPLPGILEESRMSLQDIGTKVMKYQGIKGLEQSNQSQQLTSSTSEETMEHQNNITNNEPDNNLLQTNNSNADNSYANDEKLEIEDPLIGVVSLGEVTLNSLRHLIVNNGINVEFRIDSMKGAILVCDDQVIIRKENTSDFIIEGPPIPAFYGARKALYQQFAFV